LLPADAIQREKEIKGWARSKKIKLIESMNPHRHDLAADWEDLYKACRPHSRQCARDPSRPCGRSG